MPVSKQDLVDALTRTAKGDKAAFELLYRATSLKLFGIIARILGRSDLAAEVLQEVYIRVWQRAGEYNATTSSPITWLAAIARNRALDEAKRKTMSSLEEHPDVLDLPSQDDPAASHEQNEEMRRLRECLERLEQDKRELVLLAYFNGMTREEIANRIDRPVATVKTWLRRSLAQLKDCLGQ
jgi:RNA polymerase sigma-70 factor (ECF subfamily)